MDKGSLRFRYEQRRGHYLVVEGTDDRPLTRRDCDEFQLRMLATCEVPGLLKLEAEEIDGQLLLRYALSGTRMLSQAARSNRWSMATYMGALCRLAEVMEDCRLYVLNPDCMLLDDDRIFIGEAGDQDVRFVYLPMPAQQGESARGLESLIVRWMMHVANPDGKAIQQSLRLAASPDFKPAALSRFARQYSAGDRREAFGRSERPGGTADEGKLGYAASGLADGSWGAAAATDTASKQRQPDGKRGIADGSVADGKVGDAPAAASSGWRWFQPASSDAHGMSALLGDDSDRYGEAPEAPPPPAADGGRKRVVLLCAAFGIIAMAWRWGYAATPGIGGLSVSSGVTFAVLAAAGWLWMKFRRAERQTGGDPRRHRSGPLPEPCVQLPTGQNAVSGHDGAAGSSSAPRANRDSAFRDEPYGDDEPPRTESAVENAPWGEDRTQYLESRPGRKELPTYYLAWESESHAPPIPLTGASLIIGRSKEASGHVDVTPGISRAHLELLRTGEGWTATDLGSRNGSKLNGAAMVAYESYPLQPDDTIELAGGAVYRLKYGNPQLENTSGTASGTVA